jgi:chemotaxis protein CheY-P-specific phosphatase CheC
MKKNKPVTTEDILIKLCNSVKNVLSAAAQTPIDYSPMIQRIGKTSLKPDIGCFVIFDGAFSGLVVINFSAEAALEVYQSYLMQMGIPKEELATQHTSDEVGNVMGELMNQILGDFTGKVSHELKTHITQSQPKMLTINKQVLLSIDTNLDRPQARRVSFYTGKNNIFYLELAIDRTEFIQLHDFDTSQELDPDAILAAEASKQDSSDEKVVYSNGSNDSDDLLASLGL